MRRALCGIAILLILGCIISVSISASSLDARAGHALRFAADQMKKALAKVSDPALLVRTTAPDGSWKTIKAGDWTSGFFPGLLWCLSEYTGDRVLRKAAEERTASLEEQKNNTNDHDVGFRMMCSYGNGYRITKNPAYRDVILTAARSLATRFNPAVGCVRSWNHGSWTFPVIIDNMMNLELLFWASKNGGDPGLYDIAVKHALTTMQNHVRPDGGTFHVVDYDKQTGAIVKKQTHQGYRDDSTWARGQAWAVYGFTMTYRETGDKRFLETARKLADYFISHLPPDRVPYWDFQVPASHGEPRDSSAAAIAASGLLELSALGSNKQEAQKYRTAALGMLESLCSPAYLAEGTSLASVLQHATGGKPMNSEIDAGLIYGDYYFVEALMRYLKSGRIQKPTSRPATPSR